MLAIQPQTRGRIMIGNDNNVKHVDQNQERYDYVSDQDPTTSINPSHNYRVWLNTNTGRMWVCIDNTINANVWIEQGV